MEERDSHMGILHPGHVLRRAKTDYTSEPPTIYELNSDQALEPVLRWMAAHVGNATDPETANTKRSAPQ